MTAVEAFLKPRQPDPFEAQQIDSKPIWIGNPDPVYAGLALTLPIALAEGDLVDCYSEGQGSVFQYPYNGTKHDFAFFADMAIIVFGPGATPPEQPLFSTYPFGGAQLAMGIGMDIKIAVGSTYGNFYYPASRRASPFRASASGTHTFAQYWWGASVNGGSGNAGCVTAGTAKLFAYVHRA